MRLTLHREKVNPACVTEKEELNIPLLQFQWLALETNVFRSASTLLVKIKRGRIAESADGKHLRLQGRREKKGTPGLVDLADAVDIQGF
ncbi:hypothetical protein CEXT_459741 [Caerostris extrusa]|uniref:Uncharacterized protein n=1 Tax=Caerostris extrusa TaxID=172846 RepID=A0AAV4QWM6_CAEEX|nr:hypothetical protein CEXT_459741 [Caerostris extrusa]